MDELDQIRVLRDEAQQHILDLLRAPYLRMSPWAISNACVYLDHPTKRPDDPPEAPCICGKRR